MGGRTGLGGVPTFALDFRRHFRQTVLDFRKSIVAKVSHLAHISVAEGNADFAL